MHDTVTPRYSATCLRDISTCRLRGADRLYGADFMRNAPYGNVNVALPNSRNNAERWFRVRAKRATISVGFSTSVDAVNRCLSEQHRFPQRRVSPKVSVTTPSLNSPIDIPSPYRVWLLQILSAQQNPSYKLLSLRSLHGESIVHRHAEDPSIRGLFLLLAR